MKTKLFDDGRLRIEWDDDKISILDSYNSFSINMAKGMAKYFIYLTEILYKTNKAMSASGISFHEYVNHDTQWEHADQDILNRFRKKGYIVGNYMDMRRKDLTLACFGKCFKMKQKELDLKDIDLQLMPIPVLIYIKKGLL